MWLSFYNENGVGDVLLITRGAIDDDAVHYETHDDVTLIYDRHSDQLMGVNWFGAKEALNLDGQGQVFLSDEQTKQLNDHLAELDIEESIAFDQSPKFVVGYVESCTPVEGSDHLSQTEINVGDDKLQIVCGASNIDEDMNVLVAKVGAVMPDGLIIWPGELRGVKSYGMVCSTKELDLTNLSDGPGIWELDASFTPGQPLEEVIAQLS